MDYESLISIIMPAYNAERYIAEAIESVQAQTWQNWELIIVNDGSADGTGAYLDALADSRIRVIHQTNQGVSAARNTALDHARGAFTTFLDADDLLPPHSLEARAGHLLANRSVDIVDGCISTRDASLATELRKYQPYYRGKLLPRLLRLDDRVFFGPFYMIRSSCLTKARFRVGLTHAEDLLFFIAAAHDRDLKYDFLNELVYVYRKTAGSAMTNLDGLEQGYLQLIKAVGNLRCINRIDRLILRAKIAKILCLSWLAAGEKKRSIAAAMSAAMA